MEKVFIQNRKGQKVAVIVERTENQKGLAFVMHGLSGTKEDPDILVFAEAFKVKGFTVVRFDTTNTFGESGGRYEDATVTSYFEDLEDVIAWAAGQEWYQEPFALSGHSFGGLCTALYAEKYPDRVLALAPVSPTVSGELNLKAHRSRSYAEKFAEWERTGWLEEESKSRPGLIKRLPWSHILDRLKYDLFPEAGNLRMPVLLIVGENDPGVPPEHVKLLYDALPGPKELHIIKDAPHTIRDPAHLKEAQDVLSKWIDSWVQKT